MRRSICFLLALLAPLGAAAPISAGSVPGDSISGGPLPQGSPPSAPPAAAGVVLEDLDRAPALRRAGLEEGDLIRAWRLLEASPAPEGTDGDAPRAARGELASALQWWWMCLSILPRGKVELVGGRSGTEMRWVVEPGLAEAEVRPMLPERVLGPYLEGLEGLRAGDSEPGLAAWSRALEEASGTGHESWLALRLGEVHAEERRWAEAEAAFHRALALATTDVERVRIGIALGHARRSGLEWEAARSALENALALARDAWGEGFVTAWCRLYLADVFTSRGVPEEAEPYLSSALDFARARGWGTLVLAGASVRMGWLRIVKEEYDLAEELLLHGVEIYEHQAPDTLSLTAALSNLGIAHWRRGDLRRAQELYHRALGIEERIASGSPELASTLNNLAILSGERGDLALAGDYYRRALVIFERTEPGGRREAVLRFNVGSNAYRRGDFRAADEYYALSLEYFAEHAPEGTELAAVLDNLGLVARRRERFDEAERFHRRALEMRRKNAPEGLKVSISLGNLASVFFDRGDPETAEAYFRQSLEMKRRHGADRLSRADVLHGLGQALAARGADAEAKKHLEQELAIRRELSPASKELAEAHHSLGVLARKAGDLTLAGEHFGRACDVLEGQVEKLGGSYDARGNFRAKYRPLFRDALEVSLALGRSELAFHYLERSRARGLLAMLAERDLAFAGDRLPSELRRRQHRLAEEHDRVLREMAGLDQETQGEELASLAEALGRLRVERGELVAEIRAASPRLAGLRYPEPLDHEGAKAALDPGTLLLSYSLGETSSQLFVARRGGELRVHDLAMGEAELRSRVGELLERLRRSAFPRFRGAFEATSRELHELLIAPAAEAIDGAERLLLVPDGPLHALPFAALLDSGVSQRYLVEHRPLHVAQSATLYAEIRRRSASRGEAGGNSWKVELAAFGDPRYPGAAARQSLAGPRLRSASARGLFEWQSLPHSRGEVEAITELFPASSVRVHLGPEAREEAVKVLGRGVRRIHFATHAWIDDRDPLASALALTLPESPIAGRENGLLQAWEIFEEMRLDADLVVLSACRSGLGVERAGEGLIGLSRAFQYAGARSLAVSLWSVDDRSTSALMTRFYRHLRSGQAKDEALRSAQLELLGGPVEVGAGQRADYSAPFHWAAFQLIGDWR